MSYVSQAGANQHPMCFDSRVGGDQKHLVNLDRPSHEGLAPLPSDAIETLQSTVMCPLCVCASVITFSCRGSLSSLLPHLRSCSRKHHMPESPDTPVARFACDKEAQALLNCVAEREYVEHKCIQHMKRLRKCVQAQRVVSFKLLPEEAPEPQHSPTQLETAQSSAASK